VPILTSGVTGYTSLTQQTRLALETGASPGESLLLASTTVAATMSLTTQPNTISSTTGMHLHFYVIGNTTTGTIVIAGTGPSGSVTSITYHIPVAPQNHAGFTEFTTKEAFLTVNASGITTTGMTSGSIIVYGTFAGKYLIPVDMDQEEKITHHAPEDKRGILFKNFRVVQLTKAIDLAKFDSDLYPDSLWAYYMTISNTPTVTTIPSASTSLLAATPIAATMTLTSAPTTPGQFLVFTITTNTASGTIVINGTDQYGVPYASSETVTFTSGASQTVYSSRRYSVVNTGGANQFTTTGGTGANIAVGGVYAWKYAFTWDGTTNLTPYSAALEVYDGVEGLVLPGTIFTDTTWTWSKDKEITVAAKGECQDYLVVGDPTSTTVGTNPFSSISQPTSFPMVSWPGSYYIDAASATPPVAQDGTFTDFKFVVNTGRKWMYAGDGQQRPAYVTWDTAPIWEGDATIIYPNYQNYINYFKPNTALILTAQFQGTWLGNISNTNYYENVTFTLPAKIDTFKVDKTKNPVSGVLKLIAQYDATNLSYGYKVTCIAQQPPTYTA
jgi:hypothetical protein